MIDIEKVCAILVTRGDIDLQPIIDSLPYTELIVWDNSKREDLKSSGLYAAIAETDRPVIYFQDDDCIVNAEDHARLLDSYEPGVISALMPRSRSDYTDMVLCGWGSLWDRELPTRAWARYEQLFDITPDAEWLEIGADFVWPILTPFVRLDAEHEDFHYAWLPGRTSTTAGYDEAKAKYMNRARMVRDHKSLTVIVPTLGRESLEATLDSIDIECEVIVVADEAGGDLARAERTARECDARFATALAPDHAHSYGNAQRNHGMTLATGSHLVFMDDDDAYMPGGLQLMLDAATDVPVIFRMTYHENGDVLWKDPELVYCNVGSPMFVVPNRLLGEWHAHDGVARGGDFQFISECVARQGEPLWREEIVALIRPI